MPVTILPPTSYPSAHLGGRQGLLLLPTYKYQIDEESELEAGPQQQL